MRLKKNILDRISRIAASQQAVLLWTAPLIFLIIFFFYPLAAIFHLAGKSALIEGIVFDIWFRVGRPLGFTVWQASISTILTLLLGLPGAYLFARYTFRGKSLLQLLTTLPFILPTVVVAASFNALLGPRGWINILLMRWLGLLNPPLKLLNTIGVILLAHVFYNTAVIIRVVGSAWTQLDPRIAQAARTMGASPWRALWEVTFPILRPAIMSATLLVFMFDFTSFGVILLLGGPRFATLEVEIYIQALHMLNLPLAGLLSAIQLACTLLLMMGYSQIGAQRAVPFSPKLKGEGVRKARLLSERLLIFGIVVILVILLVSPLIALGLRSVTRLDANRGERGSFQSGLTLAYYQELFINRRQSLFYVPPISAVRNSLLYAAATVGISLSLGFLAAYAQRRRATINRWLDPLLMLPLGTSAVTLGLGFIVVFNRPPVDVRSFPLLMPIAHSLVALPFVVRTIQPALASIPLSLKEAAAVLGASPWRAWREVDLPIVARAAVVGAIFSFTISLGEFGATTFLARPEFPTIPVAIYRFLSQPGALNYGQALAMATLLMLICGVGIFAIEKLDLSGGIEM